MRWRILDRDCFVRQLDVRPALAASLEKLYTKRISRGVSPRPHCDGRSWRVSKTPIKRKESWHSRSEIDAGRALSSGSPDERQRTQSTFKPSHNSPCKLKIQ